jgi:predicted nucleic acid-binding protein
MTEVIVDTGPLLHLNEINQLFVLNRFEQLHLPELVVNELSHYGLNTNTLKLTAKVVVHYFEPASLLPVLQQLGPPEIQLADAAVFQLAQQVNFSRPVLTDDLALRRQLERHGNLVIESVGLLIRAYHTQLISRIELEETMELLFNDSSLHISPAFRIYVYKLLEDLAR